jgi:hypothetical protein
LLLLPLLLLLLHLLLLLLLGVMVLHPLLHWLLRFDHSVRLSDHGALPSKCTNQGTADTQGLMQLI